jgi:hypothetical protein
MEVFQEIDLCLHTVSVRAPCIPNTGGTHLDHTQLALGHINQFDLLDGHCLAGPPIERLVDGPEGAFPDAVSESLRSVSQSAMSHISATARP